MERNDSREMIGRACGGHVGILNMPYHDSWFKDLQARNRFISNLVPHSAFWRHLACKKAALSKRHSWTHYGTTHYALRLEGPSSSEGGGS